MKIKKPIQIANFERNGLDIFADELYNYGLEYSDIIDDGQVHRVKDRDKKGNNRNGWYVVDCEDDIYFGAYGSWSRGEVYKFCSVSQKKLTADQSIRIQEKQKAAQEKAHKLHEAAANKAENVIETAPPADPSHPYLIKKHVKPHGIFQQGNKLLIPVYNIKGEIRTYQTIEPNGKKLFLKDGETKGNFHRIGTPKAKIYIAEGYATAATIHETTGECVYVAFNAGNLQVVCEAVRQLYASLPIRVAGDSDQNSYNSKGEKVNAGLDAAKFCASQVKNCSYIVPSFKSLSDNPSDFNDLFIREGKEELLKQLGEFKARISAAPLGFLNPVTMPKREFLYGKHLIRKYCSATISPGGVGKTQLVMTDAIALASGRMLLHDLPYEKVNTWHYNLEDPLDELQRRAIGICQLHNIDPNEIANNFFLNSGRNQPLIVMEKSKQGEYARPDADALYQAIIAQGISVLSIDPFVKVHYGDENSNKDIDEVLKIFSQIANDTNCAIDLVHHTKKQSKGESYAGNMDSARGASSLSGAVRSARTITVMTEDESAAFQIKDRSWYIRVDSAKSNMSAPSEHTMWLERQNVITPNGEPVGALAIWKPPSAFGKNTAKDIEDLCNMVNDGRYRKDVRAKEWVGHIIMDELNMNEAEAKRLIRKFTHEGVFVFDIETNPETRKSVWWVRSDIEKLASLKI